MPPDVELYLTGWMRAELASRPEPFTHNVWVSNREWNPPASNPNATPPQRQLIIRDDSGPATSIVTTNPSIGVTVLAGTKDNPTEANNLARLVFAILGDCAGTQPENPVAAVLNKVGPYAVIGDSNRARRYMTFDLSVVGISL